MAFQYYKALPVVQENRNWKSLFSLVKNGVLDTEILILI